MKQNIKMAFLAGLMTLLCGFITMLILWNTIGVQYHLSTQRGFFYYRAATIGDGICLPIVVGAAFFFILSNNKILKGQTRICILFKNIAVFIGCSIQAKWLISNETVLNWTIPTQHHFNFAGWYHAFFFVGMCGIIAYLVSKMWFVIKNKIDNCRNAEKVSFLLFIFAGSLYIIIHLTDNYSEIFSRNTLFAGEWIIFNIIFGIYLISANRKMFKQLASSLYIGSSISFLIAHLINFYL